MEYWLALLTVSDKAPNFGRRLGFWYPLVWRCLSLNRYFSVSMWLPSDSALAADIYVAFWWCLEIALLATASCILVWRATALLCVALLLYRLLDLAFVLFSILLKGHYRTRGARMSANRTVLLLICNGIEIMAIFSLLFYFSAQLWPRGGAIYPALSGILDAAFLSVATGTTLGYGVPVPCGTISKILAMVEVLFMVFAVLVLIASVRAEGLRTLDLENEHRREGGAG